jgi:WbqC-like protein family
VRDISQNRTIAEHAFVGNDGSVAQTLWQAYRRHPYFDVVRLLVESTMPVAGANVAHAAQHAIESICQYLSISRRFVRSSELAACAGLSGGERLIAISKHLGANTYINPNGGRDLYRSEEFAQAGIDLRFIQMHDITYATPKSSPFVPNMSMIDVLMCCSPEQVRSLLEEFSLE